MIFTLLLITLGISAKIFRINSFLSSSIFLLSFTPIVDLIPFIVIPLDIINNIGIIQGQHNTTHAKPTNPLLHNL